MKKNICVFCGASEGNRPEYRMAAEQLGMTIAKHNRRLIYGGGNKGLMGVIANAVLAHGGEVIGIIPERLVKAETAHHGITRLEVGYHEKPVALLNSQFWQPMLNFLEHAVQEGFIRDSFYRTLIVADVADEMLEKMDNFIPKDLQRWVKK